MRPSAHLLRRPCYPDSSLRYPLPVCLARRRMSPCNRIIRDKLSVYIRAPAAALSLRRVFAGTREAHTANCRRNDRFEFALKRNSQCCAAHYAFAEPREIRARFASRSRGVRDETLDLSHGRPKFFSPLGRGLFVGASKINF